MEERRAVTRRSRPRGGGSKILPQGKAVGDRLMVRWTPTYIKSDPGGMWCDNLWGCYTCADAQYSHQFEFPGGMILRLPMK